MTKLEKLLKKHVADCKKEGFNSFEASRWFEMVPPFISAEIVKKVPRFYTVEDFFTIEDLKELRAWLNEVLDD